MIRAKKGYFCGIAEQTADPSHPHHKLALDLDPFGSVVSIPDPAFPQRAALATFLAPPNVEPVRASARAIKPLTLNIS